MREILFRGKRANNKEWVEGGIIPLDTDSGYIFIAEPFLSASTLPVYEIIKHHTHLVIPETVGQFTGLTDKYGKKIFEGDILSVTVREKTVECGAKVYTGRKIKAVWTVEYKERNTQGNGFFVFGKDRRFNLFLTKSVIWNVEPEVIGNIHDNPELLKGE